MHYCKVYTAKHRQSKDLVVFISSSIHFNMNMQKFSLFSTKIKNRAHCVPVANVVKENKNRRRLQKKLSATSLHRKEKREAAALIVGADRDAPLVMDHHLTAEAQAYARPFGLGAVKRDEDLVDGFG